MTPSQIYCKVSNLFWINAPTNSTLERWKISENDLNGVRGDDETGTSSKKTFGSISPTCRRTESEKCLLPKGWLKGDEREGW